MPCLTFAQFWWSSILSGGLDIATIHLLDHFLDVSSEELRHLLAVRLIMDDCKLAKVYLHLVPLSVIWTYTWSVWPRLRREDGG